MRVLQRPLTVEHYDDEGAWDLPMNEAGDDD